MAKKTLKSAKPTTAKRGRPLKQVPEGYYRDSKGRIKKKAPKHDPRREKIRNEILRQFTKVNKTFEKAKPVVYDVREIPRDFYAQVFYYDITEIWDMIPVGSQYRINGGEQFGITPIRIKGKAKEKLSYAQRRKLVSKYIYPKFKDYKLKDLKKKQIKADILDLFESFSGIYTESNPIQDDEVIKFREEVRRWRIENIGEDVSPFELWQGYVFKVPNAKDLNSPNSYYLDIVLHDPDATPFDENVDFEEQIIGKSIPPQLGQKIKAERSLQLREFRKKQSERRKYRPKTVTINTTKTGGKRSLTPQQREAIQAQLNALDDQLKLKIITKKEYEKRKEEYQLKLK